MDEPEDMGFLAEDVIIELASLVSPGLHTASGKKIRRALRRFMFEAKRGLLDLPKS